ncbi:unnamed protein product [Trifolium pratense]|uniref:Uncharacterized protein n=2 Tax=Trifolium pratense TaxID=57577 RepID=A0ACB0I7R5_TRIPR|nr:unnamed protein product [Trifolium pratense]
MATTGNEGSNDASKVNDEKDNKSPTKNSQFPPSKANVTEGHKTEVPMEPKHPHVLQPVPREEAVPIGSQAFIFEQKMNGRLGIFFERAWTNPNPTAIEINLTRMHECVVLTLTEVIKRAIRDREYESFPAGDDEDAEALATILANGVIVLTYCKLAIANYYHSETCECFYKKPNVPDPFEVPEPYALAISQLGKVKIRGLRDEVVALPTIPVAHGTRFGLPGDERWNQSDYCLAVDCAKKIGIWFKTVDLKVKMGSTWWLLKPH